MMLNASAPIMNNTASLLQRSWCMASEQLGKNFRLTHIVVSNWCRFFA